MSRRLTRDGQRLRTHFAYRENGDAVVPCGTNAVWGLRTDELKFINCERCIDWLERRRLRALAASRPVDTAGDTK